MGISNNFFGLFQDDFFSIPLPAIGLPVWIYHDLNQLESSAIEIH
jgi:hypothetical protein